MFSDHGFAAEVPVLGGPAEVIEAFEKLFGGAAALRGTFKRLVEQMRVGSGLDDLKWAQDHW